MGKLWQRTVNEELNAALEGVKRQIATGHASAEVLKLQLDKASGTAGRQGLLATVAALAKFSDNLPDDAGLAGKEQQAKLTRRVDSILRNAQVREVGLAEVKITKPTLVYLSGFLTNDDRSDYVIGSIRRVEDLIRHRSEINEQPDIYGWTHTDLKNLFNLAVYNTLYNSRSSEAGYKVGSAILMPLVAQDFTRDEKTGAVSGKPLPLEDAKKNLKNVTLFGYSAGSVVAQETYNATTKMMKQVGFSEQDASELLKEVVLLTAGSISRMSKERNRYTTMTLTASNDRIMRAKNFLWGFLGTALRAMKLSNYTFKKHKRDLTIVPLSDSSMFVTTSVRPTLYEWNYNENGEKHTKRFFDPLYPKWTMRRSYHELPPYLTTDDNNNQFSRIALYTLINAFNRTGRIAPKELLQVPANDTHSPELQEAYRNRIAGAMREVPAAFRPA